MVVFKILLIIQCNDLMYHHNIYFLRSNISNL